MPAASGGHRKTSSAATVTVVALLACAGLISGCSGSSSNAAPPSPTPSHSVHKIPVGRSDHPDDATTELAATGTMQVGQSAPFAISTAHGDPLTVLTAPSGATSVTVSMKDQHSDLFSVEGPAKAGAISRSAHVIVFVKKSGLLIDTDNGDKCQVRYDAVSETSVRAQVTCSTVLSNQRVPVTVTLTTSG